MSNPAKTVVVKQSNLSSQSLVSLLIALIALSFAAIFIKLSEQEISAVSTVFNRLWIAAIILGGWNSLQQLISPSHPTATKYSSNLQQLPQTREIILFFLVGILGTASVLCWAWSLTQTSVANSTLMRNLSPLFTCLQGWLFFKQKFDTPFLTGLCLAVVGALLIGIGDVQINTQHLLGDGLGLLAAMFYALNLLILAYLRPKYSAVTLLFWRCTIGAIVLLPLMWLTGDSFFPHSQQGWAIIFALAIICQCFGQSMLVHNLKYFSASFIAIALLLEPTLTAMFAWFIFAESLSVMNLVGFGIVLIGLFLARNSNSSNQTFSLEEKKT